MNRLELLVPGPLTRRSGGSEYDRRIVAGLRALGWVVGVHELDASFPRPTAAALDEAARVMADFADATTVLADGLAYGAMPEAAERESRRLRLVALVHLPLAAEIGIDAEDAIRFDASERRALAAARLAIATSHAGAQAIERYGVGRERIAIVEPGTDRAPLANGSRGPLHMISVAALTPGKGHEVLLRALARIRHRPWRLTCAGSTDRHPATAARLRQIVHDEHLDQRVTFVGELDDAALGALYDDADLFVHPTLHETYGMVVAEALARGLPVVATTTGAIPDLVGTEAGLLVRPGDAEALAEALSVVTMEDSCRDRVSAGARRMRERLRTWEDAAGKMATVLTRLENDERFAR